ncbi:MAG: VOC family protein, partial [Caulobacteraceae bacterium]
MATFDLIDIVARDMGKTLAFYRLAGVEMRETWPEGHPPHHVHGDQPPQGADVHWDSDKLAGIYNEGFDPDRPRVVIGLKLGSREAVDETYERLIDAGHRSQQPPYDAFWGARYA